MARIIGIALMVAMSVSGCGGGNTSGASGEGAPTLYLANTIDTSEAVDRMSGNASTLLVDVEADDPQGDTLTFSISGGVDADAFTIDAVTGELHWVTLPDYEQPGDANQDNIYEVQVGVSDGVTASWDTMLVRVTPLLETVNLLDGGVKTFDVFWDEQHLASNYTIQRTDGISGYQQVLSTTGRSGLLPVPLHLVRANAGLLVEAQDSQGSTIYTGPPAYFDVSRLNALVGYVKASNTAAADAFGMSSAVSGDGGLVVVGAPGQETDSGAVYLFVADGTGGWQQAAYLQASDSASGLRFGRSVAISSDGGRIAVGALDKVYCFELGATGWQQMAVITGADTVSGDDFGVSVSLGRTETGMLAVGAPAHGTAGAAYVFYGAATNWAQRAKFAPVATADSFVGRSVDLSDSGAVLAVGAPSAASAGLPGSVYVYSATGSFGSESWGSVGAVAGTDLDDLLGYSVALSADGSVLVAGAPGEDSAATGVNGDATDNLSQGAGAAYVYRVDTATPAINQQAYLKATNTEPSLPFDGVADFFGGTVDIGGAGNIITVSAWQESSQSSGLNGNQDDNGAAAAGAIYSYQYNPAGSTDGWVAGSYVKSAKTSAGDQFGVAMALSLDGETLVAGSPGEDGGGTGIDSTSSASAQDSGAVFLY